MSGDWSNPAAEAIAHLVSTRTGFTYALQHPAKTEEGIRRAMAAQSVAAPGTYLEILTSTPSAMDQLMDELTIRETYFFREPRHFDFIRGEILPALRAARDGQRRLRAWSAGCASGEEAYSLAILMAQAGLAEQASVLGTDISQAALRTARTGRFRDWSLRGASPSFLASYFRAAGPAWDLIDPIKRQVRFAFLNLALDAYPSHVSGTLGMDLILCRNVLIYFDAWTVDEVARRLLASLAPGGWLVTASSDPPLGRELGYEPHVTEHGVFYRRPPAASALPMAPAQAATLRTLPKPAPAPPKPKPRRKPALKLQPKAAETPDETCERARAALRTGNYERVLELLPDLDGGSEACRLRVDALANQRGPESALEAAATALTLHPLCTTLHFRHAVLLSSLGQLDASEQALRRVIYLDRGLAVAHFALGALHWRRRRLDPARRCYRVAARISGAADPEAVLPLADGQTAGELAAAAARHLGALGEEEALSA